MNYFERIELNELKSVPEWARAERMEMSAPLSELWTYSEMAVNTREACGFLRRIAREAEGLKQVAGSAWMKARRAGHFAKVRTA